MTGTFCACEGAGTPIHSATASQADVRRAQKPGDRKLDFNTALGQQQTQQASTGRISGYAARIIWALILSGQPYDEKKAFAITEANGLTTTPAGTVCVGVSCPNGNNSN